ncbi:MAG: ABC transporter substrate-binding protein [Prevotella sp.]|uniref:ABC transporter substrate-binding protein n=1 Tax=Prevotella sp. TaxID=59823 RepID=UPI002A24F58B|nr:ABC transporter substrate-binding protein [Prevotella sp.]MDD7317307.1 ABC transporter substrate-binding protein [Prevotellaceae bacterium]MDY4019911.1 ABC transporter substrate-binding protein [Prevotella sp.]
MKKLLIIVSAAVLMLVSGIGCTGVKGGNETGDTLQLGYAERITIVEHGGYATVTLADPWKEGSVLHTYVLVPEGAGGISDDSLMSLHPDATIVHTPLKKALVTTSVHCALAEELGCSSAVGGVCDLQYINLPWVKEGVKAGRISDCGSTMAPTLETIMELSPDAIFLSPFQNSGGYGRVENLGIPIIEMADYMETSALGRAEWMKFYGMLFGAEEKAATLFAEVEKGYNDLKEKASAVAAKNGKGAYKAGQKSVIMDKLVGPVWYVPGGSSTIGKMLKDAACNYPWSGDMSAGSLSLSFETVLEKGADADVWMFRYSAPQPITRAVLLSENSGYEQFKAFRNGELYGCNTATSTFYEDTPFHPERLLRDFLTVMHPGLGLGAPKYFVKVK